MTTNRSTEHPFACPRCDSTPLQTIKTGLRCKACKTEFADVGGIPWLFAEPDAALGEWRGRLHLSLQQLAHESKRLRTEAGNAELLPQTLERLERVADATDAHRSKLRELLSSIDIQSLQAGYESHLALRTRLPSDQGLNTYYANVHRDWVWGDDENAASLAEIDAVADGAWSGNVVVLGAGAGRLAFDIATKNLDGTTYALDFNPLLLLIAQRVLSGDTLELFEFPIAPKDASSVAVLQTLQKPDADAGAIELVLADVLRPPFAAGSADVVVTPWLVDIISEDFPQFAQRVNALLKTGGRWVNFGSLAFDHAVRARRYQPDEIIEHLGAAGFAESTVREATIPYMQSPLSRHGRVETTFTFAASKAADAEKPPRYVALPDWLVTGKEPVPLNPSFNTQMMTTRIYAFIMSLIDGKRTIDDMATVLEQQRLMPKSEAVPAIRNFLIRMHEDSQRNASF